PRRPDGPTAGSGLGGVLVGTAAGSCELVRARTGGSAAPTPTSAPLGRLSFVSGRVSGSNRRLAGRGGFHLPGLRRLHGDRRTDRGRRLHRDTVAQPPPGA